MGMDIATAWSRELAAFTPIVRARLQARQIRFDDRDVQQVATAILLMASMGPGPLRAAALELQRELIAIGEPPCPPSS